MSETNDNNKQSSNRSDHPYQEEEHLNPPLNDNNNIIDVSHHHTLMTNSHNTYTQPIAGAEMLYSQPNAQQEQMIQVMQVKTGESVNSNLYNNNNNNNDGGQRDINILGGEPVRTSLPSSGTDNANPVFGTIKSQQKQYNNMLQGTKSLDGGDMTFMNNNSMMGYPPHNNMSNNNNTGNNSMGHAKQQMMGFNRRHSEPVEVAINPMNSINYNNSSGSSGSSKMGKESLGMMDYNRRHSEPGIDEEAFAPPPHMGRNTSAGSYSRRNSEPAFSLLANIFDQSVQDMDNNIRGNECGNNNMMSIQEPLEGDMVNNNNDMDHDRELESYIMSKSSDGWSSPPLPTATNTNTQQKTMQGYVRGRRRSSSAPLPEDDYMGLRDYSSDVVDGWSSPPPHLSDQSGQSSDTSASKTLEGFRKSRRRSSSAPPPESPDKITLNQLHQALKEPLDGGDNIDNDLKRRDDELESYLSKASEGWSPAQESPSSKPAQEKKKTMQGYKRNRRRSSSAPRLSDMMQVLTKLEPEPVQVGGSGRSIGSNRSSQRSRSVDNLSRGDGISSQHSSQSSLNSHHYSHMSNDDLARTEVAYTRGESFKRRKSEPLLPKDMITGAVDEGHGGNQSQDLHQSLPDIDTNNDEDFNLQQATSTDSHTDALMQMLLGSVGDGIHLNSPSTAIPPPVAVPPPPQQTMSVPVIHKPPQPQHKGSPLRSNKQAPVVQQTLLLPNQAPMAHQPSPANNFYGQPFQVAPKPFQGDPHANDLALILSAVKEAQTNLRTLQAIVIQLGDPQALEDIANAFGIAASSSQFILASDLPNAYAQLNKVWMIIKKVNDVLAYKAMQQQVLGNVNAGNLTAMQQLHHGAAGTSTGMVMPPPLTEGYITSQMAEPTQALPLPTQPLGVFNSPMQQSHPSTIPTNTVSKPPIFEPTTPTSSPMASTSESSPKPKGILKSPSPKQQQDETIPTNDPMARLKAMMERTKKSQQSLEDWDRRNGLPKSHCMTMVNSSRSRQQLQTGTILKKWTGAPLIEIKDDDDAKGKGEMITVLTVPTSMGNDDKQPPITDTDKSSHQQDISERSGRSLNSADLLKGDGGSVGTATASLFQSQENMDDTSLDSTNDLHVKGPIG